MITVFSADNVPKTIRKAVELNLEVFIQARDFYHRNKDMRHHKVVVFDKGTPVFCMGWMKNRPSNLDPDNPKVQMHLSNHWEYSTSDEGLDYSYVDRYQLIIFQTLEEYSYHSARVAMKHNPELTIAFLDPNAAYLFRENEKLLLAGSEEELFEKHPELKELKTLRVHSEMKWDVSGVFMGDVSSYEVMTSLYWIKREFYYGPENPDKTFYLIKQPVKENGLTALINNVVGVKQMIRVLRPDYIPVVDLGIANDPNQFQGTSGEDVWGMFFEQLSPYSLQEVYNSQHVILDQNSNLNLNPYMTEFTFSNMRAELFYGPDLQFRPEIVEYTQKELDRIFPSEKKRILGVVVRGSDYLIPRTAKHVPHGISTEETLEKAVQYVSEKGYDLVYLATEEQSILELFANSVLKDKLFYTNQNRLDYRKEEYQNKLLLEVFGEDQSDDPYRRTLDYIVTLEGLTRCDALLANVTCGAMTYATGRKRDYEFVDVKKIAPGGI